jgi:hypothetical protein
MNSTHNTSNGGTDGCLRLHWVQELMEQELLSLPEYLSSPRFLVGSCYSILGFMCMFYSSLFGLLSFCLSFVYLRILIIPLVSSNSS